MPLSMLAAPPECHLQDRNKDPRIYLPTQVPVQKLTTSLISTVSTSYIIIVCTKTTIIEGTEHFHSSTREYNIMRVPSTVLSITGQ